MAGLSYLADACALLDYFGGGGRTMTAAGREAMEASQTAISLITVWKLTLKAHRGSIPSLPSRDGSFARYLEMAGFRQEPFLWRDDELANRRPPRHRGPMDRMLIGTAQRAGLTIITCDAAIRGYDVKTIW